MLMNFCASSHHGTSQDTLMSIETIYILHELSLFLSQGFFMFCTEVLLFIDPDKEILFA